MNKPIDHPTLQQAPNHSSHHNHHAPQSFYTIDEQLNKRYARLTLNGHKSSVHCVRWNPDGAYLASGGKEKMVCLHRATESNMIQETRYTNNGHLGDIDEISWNPTNSSLFASASADKTSKIWDIRYIDPINTTRLKNENINVNWSSNGHTIAVADRNDWISFLDVRMNFKIIKDLKYPCEVNGITWNKENDLFFVTSGDGKIHVLSWPDLQALTVIDAFASPCVCIRFDPSGRCFAVGSNDAVSSIWCSENLACVNAINRLEWPVKAISFSHDGKYLASGSEDNFIDIAHVRTGERACKVDVTAPTLTLDFHPKQYILAYALDEHDYQYTGAIKVLGFPEKKERARK